MSIYDDPSIDEIAALIVHDPEFEEHREHIQDLAIRVLELLGEKSPVLEVRVAPDNMPQDQDVAGPTFVWMRGQWNRHHHVCRGHIWLQGHGVFPRPTPAQLSRSTELWPDGRIYVEGYASHPAKQSTD